MGYGGSMRRSTFVLVGLAAFGLILATFVVRGTTRLVVGERASLLLSFPLGFIALLLVVVLVAVGTLDRLGIRRMTDDLEDGPDEG